MGRSIWMTGMLAWVCYSSLCMGQDTDFLHEKQPRVRIMLLGTFHFKDAGLDSYKPKFDVNILAEGRQRQVAEVLDKLANFAPNKIAVEWRRERQATLNERFRQFLAGTFQLKSNEVYQLGFKLAKRLGHERLYAVDTPGRWFEKRTDPETYARAHGQESLLENEWDARYEKLYTHDDALKMKQGLRKHLLYINSEKRLLQGHGHYLVGALKIGKGDDYPGVDGFVSQWYNRNLKIFANIQRITESAEDRILLIIGAGHVPIIRHAVQASPEYTLVEVAAYL